MKQPSTKKRKSITVIGAVALALVLALSGTFAWQSLNQKALNENAQTVNPGGRMHDDFDGSNKDVYAENFGEEDLVVRVQLREYMEVGLDAGKNKTELNANRKVEAVQEGTEISKPNEWPVHKPTADAASCEGKVHEKMNWTMGGKTVYMPTFNKNQDSLKTDINGTFENNFTDYHKYTLNETKVDNEIYDADNNTVEDDGITTKPDQTHTAKETINGTVMTMEAWKAAGSQPGDYWVYDKDGWAYWANPLKPGTATGLLLDQVELSEVMDDSWYYGIKVIGQFATMDDLGKDNQTGFYKDGTAPTAEAEELLKAIGAESNVPPVEYTVSVKPETATVIKGQTQEFTAKVTASDQSTPSQDVTWSVEGEKSTSTKFTGSTLTVGADESATSLTVKATSALGKGTVGEATVTPVSYNVEINEQNVKVIKGKTQKFTAEVTATGDTPNTKVTWAVTGASKSEKTTITSEGLLTVGTDETSPTLTVTATSEASGVKGTTTVTPVSYNVEINEQNAEVIKGKTKKFTANVTATGDTPKQEVDWTVEGKNSSGTTITPEGNLTVGTDESATSLTVKATSKVSGVSGITSVKVVNYSVSINSHADKVKKGGTITFSAQVTSNATSPDKGVNWEIVGAHHSGTTISTGGLLSVSPSETQDTLTIKATSKAMPAATAQTTIKAVSYGMTISPSSATVIQGKTQQFSAKVTCSDGSTPDQNVTWAVTGGHAGTSITSSNGLLTVAENESAKTLTVKAISAIAGEQTVTVTIKESSTLPSDISSEIKNNEQSGNGDSSKYVTIDGIDFYVLNVDNTKNQALLLARYAEKDGKPFNTDYKAEPGNNQWQGSEIQKRMQTYLNNKPTLSKAAVTVTLNTLGEFDGSKPRIESRDKVFLLSEADVFGSHTGTSASAAKPEDYTLGKTGSVVPVNLRKATNKQGESMWWWLRSPRSYSEYVAAVDGGGTANVIVCYSTAGAVRPALVVNL